MQAIKFVNFSNEDFTGVYDKQPTTVKAGEEMYLVDHIARHFAKHLIDRELNRLGVKTNHPTERQRLMDMAFPPEESISETEAIDTEIKKKRAPSKKKVEKEEFAELEE